MRKITTKNIKNFPKLKEQLLSWAQQYDEVVWLDSNNYEQKYADFDAVLAVDAFTVLQTDYVDAFDKLKEYQSITKDWLFGYLSYDLKNDTENLVSQNPDHLLFPELFFFQPKKLFLLKQNEIELHYLYAVDDEIEDDWQEILNSYTSFSEESSEVKIKLKITKDSYFEKFQKIINHINRGDIYEMNFCQEFFAENTTINPLQVYQKLNNISNSPFATFLKVSNKFLLSASPERYIKKSGTQIVSQPIKGTAKRSTNKEEDEKLKYDLEHDQKERSENIMIVDLVRNDLSKTALKGSVQVPELCKIYTFDQVHQMISTITSKVAHTKSPVEVLRTTYPMGSMTGAPKVSAMKIIEEVEESKRGLYSGSVGYFTPDNDFDFNVVIRSILYNETNKYVSYSVGGAITAKAKAEAEYEECLLKAKAMREALLNKG
ncbi:aminodeoxychorismate synthase component I [Pseudofulvibacter geojedonensis]|uniref:Aminodeoxychorismate synthase component I n=1 Tax=Pseudofulvibacter geojedonensis TaxID=1123758 RepID=A0ABW3HYC0_9FLAO